MSAGAMRSAPGAPPRQRRATDEGGTLRGTGRRKKKAVHKATSTDDKRLQNTLKRLGVNTIPGIEEVNIFKDDTVIHCVNPKGERAAWRGRGQASRAARHARACMNSACLPWSSLAVAALGRIALVTLCTTRLPPRSPSLHRRQHVRHQRAVAEQE